MRRTSRERAKLALFLLIAAKRSIDLCPFAANAERMKLKSSKLPLAAIRELCFATASNSSLHLYLLIDLIVDEKRVSYKSVLNGNSALSERRRAYEERREGKKREKN